MLDPLKFLLFSNVSSANKVVSFELAPSVKLSHPAYPWEISEGAFLHGTLMEGTRSLYALNVISLRASRPR